VSTPSGSGPRPRFGERPVMATDGRGLKKSFLSFPYPSFPYPVGERITQYSASSASNSNRFATARMPFRFPLFSPGCPAPDDIENPTRVGWDGR
jgi:hypothetical protein